MSKLTGVLPAAGMEVGQTDGRGRSLRVIVLTSLGGALEGYDYLLYGLFASYISAAFFPTQKCAVTIAKPAPLPNIP